MDCGDSRVQLDCSNRRAAIQSNFSPFMSKVLGKALIITLFAEKHMAIQERASTRRVDYYCYDYNGFNADSVTCYNARMKKFLMRTKELLYHIDCEKQDCSHSNCGFQSRRILRV